MLKVRRSSKWGRDWQGVVLFANFFGQAACDEVDDLADEWVPGLETAAAGIRLPPIAAMMLW